MVYRLDDTLGFSIHKAAVRLKQSMGGLLRPFSLTPEQFGVLARLWEQEGLSQRELAEMLYKDKPTVTRMLEKLEQRGLISRKPDVRDRRIVRVYLTEAGKKMEQPILEAIRGWRSKAYKGFDPDRQKDVRLAMEQIFDNLDPENNELSAPRNTGLED